jgi:citrate synthase
MNIHDRIAAQLPAWRERVLRLRKNYGALQVGDVTVEQIYGGIRGVQIQVSDISYVDPLEGIRLRGYSIPEVIMYLPRVKGTEFPMAGALFYLLMADTLPTEEEALEVEHEWYLRSEIPAHVYDTIHSFPKDTHPMTLFTAAILALQPYSIFAKRYAERMYNEEGLPKSDYWLYNLEDSFNLVAKLPGIASYIYNLKYRDGVAVPYRADLDWGANFANMIGKGDDLRYQDLARLFFVIHSDHEGGNVSAHAAHLVSSALSDVYYSCAAGMTGLAGPLHGLANQECLRWLLNVREHFDNQLPSREALRAYLTQQLAKGRVIPGYGHAVLRTTDPRFTVQYEFAKKYLADDEIFQMVRLVFEVLPAILAQTGKVKNPWPNVDAINGALQYHFGVTQFDFYTVMFGVSRILGLTSHIVWARALGKPIERPKSLTTAMLEEMTAKAQPVPVVRAGALE